MSFALTKIQRPLRRADLLIERPALEQRLGAALLTQRLVLLSAAAGFGKSSALARQLELLPAGTGLAWVACDEGDSLPAIVECLVAALEPLDLPWRIEPDALVRNAAQAAQATQATQPAPATHSALPRQLRAVVAELVNALDASAVEHGVIVLDDLHRIDDPAVFAALDELVMRLSSRWTLVLSTRFDPPLALARLRAQDQLTEFRLDDLRFEPEEVERLLAAAGLSDADGARHLFERTQGWPVGLRLALNTPAPAGTASPKGRPASVLKSGAIDRHVFDFLADEVTDKLEPALRDFLFTTSVLPELTAARCAALSGDALAALRLEQIERAGLFVTLLDADEPTLRLHDLFREALETRFQRDQPARWQSALRLAATTEPDLARRVAWLQRAGDWDEAELVLMEVAETLDAAGAPAQLRTLIDRFPAPRRDRSPRLQMVLARSRWDWDSTIVFLEQAAAQFSTQGAQADELKALSHRCLALSGANRHAEVREAAGVLLARPELTGDARTRTLVALAWVELSRGDQRQLPALWEQLIDLLLASDSLARWTECAPLTPFAGLPGMRAPLQRFVDEAARRWPEHPTPLRGQCHLLQAWLHLFAGDVVAAERCAEACAEDARWLGAPPNLDAPSRALQAVLAALRGRRDDALGSLSAVITQIAQSGVPLRAAVYLDIYRLMAMRCAALLDDAAALRTWASALQRAPAAGAAERSWISPAQRAAAPAHLALLDGDLDRACRQWQVMLDDEAQGDLYGQRVDTRLRLADGLLRQGAGAQAAAAVLEPLFAQLQMTGDPGAVLLAGPQLLRRLAQADWARTLPAAAQAQLAAWARQSQALTEGADVNANAPETAVQAGATPPAAGQDTRSVHVSTLTAREGEVLAMIASGDSNKLIARALDLSPHTVKRHVANILDKLLLSSRGQAAAWYHDKVRP
jgi:LuxR family transcriptional regulator, maltose regulon positive regulatory protein